MVYISERCKQLLLYFWTVENDYCLYSRLCKYFFQYFLEALVVCEVFDKSLEREISTDYNVGIFTRSCLSMVSMLHSVAGNLLQSHCIYSFIRMLIVPDRVLGFFHQLGQRDFHLISFSFYPCLVSTTQGVFLNAHLELRLCERLDKSAFGLRVSVAATLQGLPARVLVLIYLLPTQTSSTPSLAHPLYPACLLVQQGYVQGTYRGPWVDERLGLLPCAPIARGDLLHP